MTQQKSKPRHWRRDAIKKYKLENPNSTVAEIKNALGLSSTTVVQHHLVKLRLRGELPDRMPKKILAALHHKQLFIALVKEAIDELDKIINKG